MKPTTTATTGQFKVEVIADDSGKWCSNALRFDSQEAAAEHGRDLFGRWTAVREYRVVNVDTGEVVKR